MFTQLTDNVAVSISQSSIKYCIIVDDLCVGFADTYDEATEILNYLTREIENDTRKRFENGIRVYTEKKNGKIYVLYQSLSYLSLGGPYTEHVLYIMPTPRYIVRPRIPPPYTETCKEDEELIRRIKRIVRS